MERKGVYRRGSSSHIRNVSRYRVMRERFRRWRFPLTALLAIALVFGTGPVVGEEFQTSVLTAEQEARINEVPVDEARKVLLNALNEYSHECGRFQMDECVKTVQKAVGVVAASETVSKMVATVDEVEERFDETLARKTCIFDAGALVSEGVGLRRKLAEFVSKNDEYFAPNEMLTAALAELDAAVKVLDTFVQNCH